MTQTLTPSMRRSVLIAALRDPGIWPRDFKWHFGSCTSCAMGLLAALTRDENAPIFYVTAVDWAADRLGLPRLAANDLFNPLQEASRNRFGYQFTHLSQITPDMVADRLQAIHRELEP